MCTVLSVTKLYNQKWVIYGLALYNLLYTMSLISASESPIVSPAASTEQKYTPLSHHMTSVMTKSASVNKHNEHKLTLIDYKDINGV